MAIVALARNSAARIREWLAFHLVQGVDHFFIVDDESTDNLTAELAPAIRRSRVTLLSAKMMAARVLHPLNIPSWQSTVYNNVFLRFGSLFALFGVWDTDEFVYSIGRRSLPGAVEDVLARFPAGAGVCMNWEMMSSMGRCNKTDGLLIETFTEVMEPNQHVKCIARSDRVHELWVHNHFPARGYIPYTEAGDRVETFLVGNGSNLTDRHLHINHYYFQSREEFLARIAASRWPFKQPSHWRPERGAPQRPGVQRFVPAVRAMLALWRAEDHSFVAAAGAAAGQGEGGSIREK